MIVYTDGACSQAGVGGWAWEIADGACAAGYEPGPTTNQRMELYAALDAVRALSGENSLTIVSDSSYLVNCFKDGWYKRWAKNGWKGSIGKPVSNQDIWRPLVQMSIMNGVEYQWVKGHNGDPQNESVDRLAVMAKERFPWKK